MTLTSTLPTFHHWHYRRDVVLVVAGRYRPPVVIKSAEHISGIKTEDEDTHAYHLDTDNEDDQDDRHIKNEVIKKEEYGTTDDEGEGDTDDDETDDECGK